MKVHNTLSGKQEELAPQNGEVKMYVCGVTPYDEAHLGHAMSYIVFDAVRRYLKFRGYRVKYVQNVTDVDDKIIDRAHRLNITAKELAEKYTTSFFEDMDALNVSRGQDDVYPRATEEIPKMLEVIGGLVSKGFAYAVHGDVYFRVRSVADYGKLSHRTLDSMTAGMRVDISEHKEDPMDFVLWKASKPGEPEWESPWGKGRPGWHTECTAMSLKYLGETLDIHGGGQDLIFPHHENEIAQSESFSGVKPFVKCWMHNGLLQLGEEKMSKSLGNLVTIKDVLKKHSSDAIRIFVLNSSYRSPLTYTQEALEAAEKGAERLREVVNESTAAAGTVTEGDLEPAIVDARKRFNEAMDNDFGTPGAVAALFDLARHINKTPDSKVAPAARLALKELAGVLGLTLRPWQPAGGTAEAAPFIQLLLETREGLRKAKHFKLADEIRARLDGLDIVLEDTPNGTVWKRKRPA